MPTDAEKAGTFPQQDLPAIYDPTTLQQFTSNGTANVIPSIRIAPQAVALLNYFPEPNLPGDGAELSSAVDGSRSNTTQAGVRYMRSLGANASPLGRRARRWRRWRRAQNAAESGTAAEHQRQLQLEPLRLQTK